MKIPSHKTQRRNKCFEETHSEMIETAVRLIAEKGIDSVSIAALARAMGINRTTVYYHFDSRSKLIDEVKAWSSSQLAGAFKQDIPRQERIEHIYSFVLDNPELLKMWMDDLLTQSDIRTMYPHWDELVNGMKTHFRGTEHEHTIDPEVFCVNLLTSAFMGPRIFKNSVCPEADNHKVIERFKAESLRMLEGVGLV